jgi:hypothetical protein
MHDVLFATGIRAIGARAAAALKAAAGRLEPLPEFPHAPYRRAGREIVWVGQSGPMHPRAIFIDASVEFREGLPEVPAPWSAPLVELSPSKGQAFRAFARVFLPGLAQDGKLSGFGSLLAGRPPLFPLAARTDACYRASAAALAGNPAAFTDAARGLIGAGLGLTPSGDDFVGAAVFTLRALYPDDVRWTSVASLLAEMASSRTHTIAAALFTDLAQGQSFAPLHDLFNASDIANFARSANAIAAIGHSSGRDMLAGIVAASIGLPPLLKRINEQDAP